MTLRSVAWPAGTPCWVDLAVPDLAAATAFYGAVLGWSFVDSGEQFGHYNIAQTQGHAAAAIGPLMQPGQSTAWTVYLASDDVDATAKLITENGGTVLGGPMDMPGTGRMLIALDAVGGSFGVWQSAGMIGAEIVNEPGSLTWTDARLPDPQAGRAFFAAVFGYTYDSVPGAPDGYGIFSVDGEVRGGIGGMTGGPAGMPAHWLAWFSVADLGAAVTAARAGGGTVVSPASDTPFGQMSILTDPFGAVFGLHMTTAAS
jgi:predicted enzyme related to lactoylglutathione lyase